MVIHHAPEVFKIYVRLYILSSILFPHFVFPDFYMILGVENPLLDITVNVYDKILSKYQLEANAAILAGPEHLPLLAEIKTFPDAFYSAGGATQNAMRTAQWIMGGNKVQSKVTYMGCVGDDDNMQKMKESVEVRSGVKAVYQIDHSHPTGTCGVLVSGHGKYRSLVANLGAANHFQKSHLENHKSDVLDKASLIYSSGFFITAATDSLDYLCKYISESSKKPIFAFNLAAPFICQVEPFRLVLMRTITHVDYLFGNDAEAKALAEALEWTEIANNVSEIARKISNLEKSNGRKRVVIITQGAEPTVVATQGESEVDLVSIIPVPEEEIVDSNGCGDAYAGAFIAGLLLGKPLKTCCAAGAYAGNVVIKRSGVTLPESSSFEW